MSSRQRLLNPLWEHFDKKDQNIGVCKYCSVNISYKSTTGNLRCHLKSKHPHILAQVQLPLRDLQDHATDIHGGQRTQERSDDLEAPSTSSGSAYIYSASSSSSVLPSAQVVQLAKRQCQRTINSYVVKPIAQEVKKKIDRDLLNLFTDDMQPFNIVENKGFKKLLSWIPGYNPPSRKTISSSLIPALYEQKLNECKTLMESEVVTACITTDCWTSCNNESYVAVTAHYISKEYRFKSILLGCRGCPGSHTSEYLGQQIKQIALEWGLLHKINFAVSDNAANICNAIQFELRWKHYGCFAHTLNLIVKDALGPLQNNIEKVRKIVAHFKRSPQANDKMVKYQTNHLGIEQPKKVIMEVATRWNSTYLMINRFLELSDAIKATMAIINREWPILSEEEWALLQMVAVILAPFEEITSSLSGEKYVSGGLAIVLVNCLLQICDEMLLKPDFIDIVVIQNMILKLKSGLETRFNNIENSKTLALCTLLDPRFKLATFKNNSSKIAIKQYCQELMEDILSRQPTSTSSTTSVTSTNTVASVPSTSVWTKIDSLVNSTRVPGTPLSKALREMKLYLEDEMLPRQNHEGKWNDPTEWWLRHNKIYPTLAEIYRTKCNIVITSVPCERIFSKAGYILNERRSRLSTSKLEQLIFLNANATFHSK